MKEMRGIKMQKRRSVRHFLTKLLLVTMLLGNMGTGYLAETWMTSAQAASGVQVQTSSNTEDLDFEMLLDDVTPGWQNRLSRSSYLQNGSGATPSIASPSEYEIKKEAVTITAADIVVSLGVSGFDLLDGVTAEDENGNSVSVSIQDDGGFDIDAEDTYTVVYEAEHPVTEDVFTENRAVTVFAFDLQPTTLEEVQAAIDAYETEYQAAMAGGGFLAALEVQKPRWQYEVDSSLMPSGWRCDYLEEDVSGVTVTCWSFFPAPVAMAADRTVGNYIELQGAIDAAPVTGAEYVIEITANFDYGTNAALAISAYKNIIIQSASGGTYTLTQSTTDSRHFTVNANGSLTLVDIILDGGSAGGGVYVASGRLAVNSGAVIRECNTTADGGGVMVNSGELTVGNGAVIQKCNAYSGGGVCAANSTVELSGGQIINNTTFRSNGGGIYASSTSVLYIKSGVIGNNTSSFYGGGISVGSGSKLVMTGGQIINNTANISSGYGGGIHALNCLTVEINGGEISGNRAKDGGGVYMMSTSFKMTDGTISGNTAAGNGGGIYTGNPMNLTTASTVVFSGNTAANAYDYGLNKKGQSPYQNIDWNGENSIPGTHALNNYDINWDTGTPPTVYTVTYKANGGAGNDHVLTAANGASHTVLALAATGISRDGYNFTGWNTSAEGDGTAYNPGGAGSVGEIYNITANVTLYAQWRIKECTVTYDANGGTGGGTYTVDHGTSHTVLAPEIITPTVINWSGHTFIGWKTAGGAPYQPGNPITITDDITLFAQWQEIYTVAFDKNGGDTDAAPAAKTVEYPATTVRTLPAQPTWTGHTFQSWNTQADGNGTQFRANTPVTDNIRVYAQWTENAMYTVTYNANGGTGTVPTDADSPYYTGSTVTVLGGGALSWESYTFTGWNTDADGAGISYTAGNSFTITGDVVLYAQWLADNYNVIYNANGGNGSYADSVQEYGSDYTVLKRTDTGIYRSGYTFTGWNTAANGSGTVYAAGDKLTITGDVALHAQWKYASGGGDGGGNPTSPTKPTSPTDPTSPTAPTSPTDPTVPTDPSQPTIPYNPNPEQPGITVPPGDVIIKDGDGNTVWEGYTPDGHIDIELAPGKYIITVIDENEVPLTYIMDIPAPLANLAKTGDNGIAVIWLILLMLSAAAGTSVLVYVKRKKESLDNR